MWHLAFYRDWEDFLHRRHFISKRLACVTLTIWVLFLLSLVFELLISECFVRRRTRSHINKCCWCVHFATAWLTCFTRIDGLLTFPLSIVCLECFSFSLAFCSGGHCLNLKCRIWDSITWGVCVCVKVWSVFWPSFPFSVFFDVLVCMLDLWKIHSS